MPKHLPAQPMVHSVRCPQAFGNKPTTTAQLIKEGYEPTLHGCTGGYIGGPCIITTPDYPEHKYDGCMIWPAGISRPLCIVCHGTHEGEVDFRGRS